MQNQSSGLTPDPSVVMSRLKEAYAASTLTELAARMGVPGPTVKGWSQRGSVPLERLMRTSADTGCSLDWLCGLVSDPPGSHAPASKDLNQSSPIEPISKVLDSGSLLAAEHGQHLPGRFQVAGSRGPLEFVLVPRFSAKVSAGAGFRYGDDEVLGEIAFEANWMRQHFGRAGDGFALVDVVGGSMEPTYYDGQTIVVDRLQRDIDGGGVFVLRKHDELFVKRIQRMLTGGLQVISDNLAFHAEMVPAGSEQQLEVVGRVVWPRSR